MAALKVAFDGGKCKAWLDKALGDVPITAAEAKDFNATSSSEERLASTEPFCKQFLVYQHKCSAYYEAAQVALMEPKSAGPAVVGLLNAMQTEPGCKSIIGLKLSCLTVKEFAQSSNRLPPEVGTHLSRCADNSVVESSNGFLRPML
jgi:hypothetical protein